MNIILKNTPVTYSIKRSKLSRRLKLSISGDGELLVTLPGRIPEFFATRFIKEHEDWILEKLDYYKKQSDPNQKKLTTGDYLKYKYRAYRIAKERVEYFNQFYNFEYKSITIRNQKTRWGSCSSNKNLNFSFRIAFLPEDLRDYIIVHELCHLGEFNHSHKFYQLIFKTIPNYRSLIRKLKPLGTTL